jgi:hypothetical protein
MFVLVVHNQATARRIPILVVFLILTFQFKRLLANEAVFLRIREKLKHLKSFFFVFLAFGGWDLASSD